MVAKVKAILELDVEEIVKEIQRRYGEKDVSMDDILEYVRNNVSLKVGHAAGIKEPSDGWAVDCFDERTYDEIDDIRESIMEEEN